MKFGLLIALVLTVVIGIAQSEGEIKAALQSKLLDTFISDLTD
jgi:hypothetical protein